MRPILLLSLHSDRSISPSFPALTEIWFPPFLRCPSILQHPLFADRFPAFQSLRSALPSPLPSPLPASFEHPLDRTSFKDDLLAFLAFLSNPPKPLPPRYFFAPAVPSDGPLPTYSRRRLKTGWMEAAFDRCSINRNWDGTDRFEDLTDREDFEDIIGLIRILRFPLSAYLGEPLRAWLAWLEQRPKASSLSFSIALHEGDSDLLLSSLLERAERFRQSFALPSYHRDHLLLAEKRLQGLLNAVFPPSPEPSKKSAPPSSLPLWPPAVLEEIADIGAFFGEILRSSLGGIYLPLLPSDSPPASPSPSPSKKAAPPASPSPPSSAPSRGFFSFLSGGPSSNAATPPAPSEAIALLLDRLEPRVRLLFPWAPEIRPFDRLLRSALAGKVLPLALQADVWMAHRRQDLLQRTLGAALWSPSPLERRAALRLLDDIADLRVAQILAERLALEDDPDLLLRLLLRLQKTPLSLPSSPLLRLATHPLDSIAGLSLQLLGRQAFPGLPDLLEHLLAGGSRMALRPLARVLLEALPTARAKKILKSLGPIPLLPPGQPLFPLETLRPSLSLPLFSEILESSDDPAHPTAALKLLTTFPEDEEMEIFGSALADPDPTIRFHAIDLLAVSDRPPAIHLLKSRRSLETDPASLRRLQQALFPPKPEKPTDLEKPR